MFKAVRHSKYRHVYGECKLAKYNLSVPIGTYAHDSQLCAVNTKYVAIVMEVDGGGAFIVIPIEQSGKIDVLGKVTGHIAPVLDIKWNPFNENQIASCSEDCTIKVWNIPDGGLKSDLTTCVSKLSKHSKKVTNIEWHPTAENILFSCSFDNLVIVWNLNTGMPINIIGCHHDTIHSIALNRDGSLLATTCKDTKLRIIEPRTGQVQYEGVCHENKKASKVTFLGENGQLLTTGFTKNSGRQYSVWDPTDLSAALTTETLDSSAGILFPFYDYDTGVLYLAGKGDGNISYFEIVNEAPFIHYLNIFHTSHPQRGLGVMPKRGLNTNKCEVYRFYKLNTTKNMCEPISMIVPRSKSETFHCDIYPNTAGPTAALSAEEWIDGYNASPILISLDLAHETRKNELNVTPKVKQEIVNQNQYQKKRIPEVTPKPIEPKEKENLSYFKDEMLLEVNPQQINENKEKVQEKLNEIFKGALTEADSEDEAQFEIEPEPLSEELRAVVDRISVIREEIVLLRPTILSVTDSDGFEYYARLESYFNELDHLKTEGNQEVRQKRKEVMSIIRKLTDHLDSL